MIDDIVDIGQAGILVLLGTVLSMFSGFLFRLIGARYLTTDQFGLVVLGISVINIASVPCILGLNQGVVKFLAIERERGKRDTYISISILIVFSLSTLATIFGYLNQERLSEYLFGSDIQTETFLIFLLTIPLFSLLKLISGILRGEMNSRGFVYVSKLVRPGTKLVFTGAAIWWVSSTSAVALAFLLSILITVLSGFYLLYSEGWSFSPKTNIDVSELIQFSLPLSISSSVFILLSHIDKLLIGFYQAAAQVAIYEVAVTIAGLLGLFRSAFGFLLYPKLSEQFAERNHDAISRMYRQTTKWILTLTTPAFVVLFTRPDLLVELFGPQYDLQIIQPLLALLGFGLFANAVVGPNGEALLGFGRSRIVLVYNLVSVALNLILNVVLIPPYGPVGAAVASLTGYLTMNLLKSMDLYVNHGVAVITLRPVVMSAIAIIVGYASLALLPQTDSLLHEFLFISVAGAASLSTAILMLWILGEITKSDRELIRSILPVI